MAIISRIALKVGGKVMSSAQKEALKKAIVASARKRALKTAAKSTKLATRSSKVARVVVKAQKRSLKASSKLNRLAIGKQKNIARLQKLDSKLTRPGAVERVLQKQFKGRTNRLMNLQRRALDRDSVLSLRYQRLSRKALQAESSYLAIAKQQNKLITLTRKNNDSAKIAQDLLNKYGG